MIELARIEPNRNQPRKNFDEAGLEELTESIRQLGVLQPILLKPEKDRYRIIAGERRWRAAKLAGLKEVPAIVRDYSEQEIVELSLIENIQREDLNVMEEARAYECLLSEFGYRQEDLAKKISKSRSVIANRLRLLKLSEKVQSMVEDGNITEGHARALLPLEDPELQFQTAMKVMDGKLSVRETERLVGKLTSPEKQRDAREWEKEDQIVYEKLEEDLRALTGTKVSIQRKSKEKGKIVIDYFSADELERLIDLFRGKQEEVSEW